MIKKILSYVGFIIGVVLFGTVLFALSFRTPLFSGMKVYFYKALLLAFVCFLLTGIILFVMKAKLKKFPFDLKDIVLAEVFLGAFLVCWITVIQCALDRSISVFLLSEMATNSEKTYTIEEIQDVFLDVYVEEYGAMDRRFMEQVVSGNVEEVAPGEYQITDRGEWLIDMFRLDAKIFPVDDKFLYPESHD